MNLVSQAEYAELGNRIRHPIQSRSPLVIVHSAAPASFEPSSGSLNPLEGIAFCRKVISVLRPLYTATDHQR